MNQRCVAIILIVNAKVSLKIIFALKSVMKRSLRLLILKDQPLDVKNDTLKLILDWKIPYNAVIAVPTKSGNGFERGVEYIFFPTKNRRTWWCNLNNGHGKIDSIDGKQSAHLWDGVTWLFAGRFNVIRAIK